LIKDRKRYSVKIINRLAREILMLQDSTMYENAAQILQFHILLRVPDRMSKPRFIRCLRINAPLTGSCTKGGWNSIDGSRRCAAGISVEAEIAKSSLIEDEG
jgi:hypothetical protein